ncbi:MAG: hypothetical protein B7Z06_08125 [Flavobacteriales bacterium 32-35-8]|nr:MAG: hypothetical protein B7Z06_08125 [Flavobacteriales bacterium 32-35-8]
MLIKNPKSKFGNLLIINLLNSNAAFSFFNYIFLGERLNETDKDAILKHEMVHVKEKHTFDLLFFEVMRIFFWFNPLVYMYQNRIMTLHEFIADQQAVKHQDKTQYYQNLLSQVFQTQNISFINPFFKQSLIKKRIVMLQKSKSKQVKLFKYGLLIPIIFGMLVYTSSYGQEKDKSEDQEKTPQPPTSIEVIKFDTHKDYSNEVEVPFAVVEEVPIFKGCEDLNSSEEKRKCTSNKIQELVGKNFNTSIASENGLTGRQRITVLFKISAEGNIVDAQARAPHPALEKEAVRVVNTLPKMLPGKQKGKNVMVPYSLPIVFVVSDTDETTNPIDISTSFETTKETEKIMDDVEVPFAVIEHVPIFPGCEDLASNDEKKRCASDKIQEFVAKNFNKDIASEKGLVGRQRITTMFKINTEGNIVDVQSRAPHPALEEETIRVVKLLPKMQPGKQKGREVVVPYSLPIVFVVQD